MENDNKNKITIVGGQPSADLPPTNFSSNIEKILLKAATDEDFKNSLLQDRKLAIEKLNLSLTIQDKTILETISLSSLAGIIEKLARQRKSRRNFIKGAAAGVALISIASIIAIETDILYPFIGITMGMMCKRNIQNITKSLDIYATDNEGVYPDSLEVLTHAGPSRKKYYMKTIPTCPASNNYYDYTKHTPNTYTLKCSHQSAHNINPPLDIPTSLGTLGTRL